MAWIRPEHSKDDVNSAGKIIHQTASPDLALDFLESRWDEYERALVIVNNWRGSHGYPLITLRINLTRIASRFDDDPLIAQRIKRLWSITHKLNRIPGLKLTQMQDLGGCRAILHNVSRVKDVVQHLEASNMKHVLFKTNDYITQPKKSGYRGVHMVYEFRSENKKHKIYNGQRIEMQLRSRHQHAWATAVETVGTFSGQALKSSLGNESWLRFFQLMGSAIALREESPLVPNTPTNRADLVKELRHLSNQLQVSQRMLSYRHAVRAMSATAKDANFYLLELNVEMKQLNVKGFKEEAGAAKAYDEAEARVRQKQSTDAVLVSVDSVASLGRAYPNYFADTRAFEQLMRQALSGKSRGIEVPPVPIEEAKASVAR
jgi:Region found in RelA / SpoT proteins